MHTAQAGKFTVENYAPKDGDVIVLICDRGCDTVSIRVSGDEIEDIIYVLKRARKRREA